MTGAQQCGGQRDAQSRLVARPGRRGDQLLVTHRRGQRTSTIEMPTGQQRSCLVAGNRVKVTARHVVKRTQVALLLGLVEHRARRRAVLQLVPLKPLRRHLTDQSQCLALQTRRAMALFHPTTRAEKKVIFSLRQQAIQLSDCFAVAALLQQRFGLDKSAARFVPRREKDIAEQRLIIGW